MAKKTKPTKGSEEDSKISVSTAPDLPPDLAKVLSKDQPKSKIRKTKDAVELASEASPSELPEESKDELAEALDDLDTDQAVDDIVRNEADEVLASEDAKRASASPVPAKKRRGFFATWWHSKWARNITILLILSAIAAAMTYPQTRYYILNTIGVRSSASLTVIDNSTQLPLKNVTVSVGGQQVKTNSDGYAELNNVLLGSQTLVVQRTAFAPVQQAVTIGWGSNPLGEFVLRSTGARYTLAVRNYVSGLPVAGAEAEVNGFTARSDEKGVISLTLESDDDQATALVTIGAANYHSQQITMDLSVNDAGEIQLVPSGREIFVDHSQGRYDLAAVDVDGKNRQVLLPGTGLEDDNISLLVDQSGRQAALVSSRDDARDRGGSLLRTLTLVNLSTGTPTVLTHAKQIQLIDWVGTRLVFLEASADVANDDPQRFRLMSYDVAANSQTRLAAAPSFSSVIGAADKVYFSATISGANDAAFYRINPDGSGRQVILNKDVWSVFRTGYHSLHLQTADGWLTYQINGSTQTSGPPEVYTSRIYAGKGKHNLWIKSQEGRSSLMDYISDEVKDKEIISYPGLGYPARWLNDNTAIFRVSSQQETADYAVDIRGGQSKKIVDVVNTYGVSQVN